ncbi:hypothetical protein N9313_01385 [Flavobacteriaceae bacterium]|nr:hypothetical protein [Flavobacteriaceae bacterium]
MRKPHNKLLHIIIPILIIGSIFAIVSNSIVFRGYIIQQKGVADMNNIVPKMTIDEALENDLIYPNINIFTVPFKTALARVYLRDSLYNKAIINFHKARDNNPFLLINENYLAQTYLTLAKKDSFKFYAKKIFRLAPNHPNHFGYYLKSLDSLKTSSKIDSAFNRITKKSSTIWKIYLAAIYNTDSLSKKAEKNIRIADSLYPKEKEIQYLIEALKYGQPALKKSDEYVIVADAQAQNNNFLEAIKILKKALELYPTGNSIHDKIATSYFKIEQYDSSLFYLNKINLKKYDNLGRYHLIKGVNLVNLGNKEEGCNEIYEAILLGNKEAIKANRSFCN